MPQIDQPKRPVGRPKHPTFAEWHGTPSVQGSIALTLIIDGEQYGVLFERATLLDMSPEAYTKMVLTESLTPSEKPPSNAEIAKAAGVSPMAVSYALRGKVGGEYVSWETAKRIAKIALRMGWRGVNIYWRGKKER